MNLLTTFDSTKESLLTLLTSINNGKIQLPDFQRGWVWDDEHIRDLLVSISLSYPIGTVMLIETGNPDVKFKPRLVEGVTLSKPPKPELLILDGQQRLTSLFQALLSGQPVFTRDNRGKPIVRRYYLDIVKALDPNTQREEAIVGVPEVGIALDFRGNILTDYSTPAKEYNQEVFPFVEIFDCSDWRSGYQEFWDYDKDKIKLFDKFEKEVIERFKQYQVPLIRLKKETPKDAVCHVFEKVNTGGVPLTVFELLTATYAAEDFQMRQDWDKREKELKKQQVLETIQNTDFLQALTLLVSLDGWFAAKKAEIKKLPSISCRRKDILRLTLGEYTNWAERLTEGFKEAARLLRSQKIFTTRDLPYRSQLIPLAAILTWLNSRARNDGVRTKLARWYWCGVFGELYGSSGETFFAKDFVGLLNWINGHMEPDTIPAIVNANFAPSRLLNLRNRNSAAYKGLYALLMCDDCLDFRTGEAIDVQMYFDDKIDIHHIFPKEWCKQKKIDPKLYDSIINKTPLSAKTNRMIGSNAPSGYLARIQKNAGISEERMNEILRSHLIDPVALRGDDFDTFFQARKEALLDRIEKAMDKPIPRDVAEPAEYEDETESYNSSEIANHLRQ
jgi:hypothetical protein